MEFDQALRSWTRFRCHGTDLARDSAPVPETTLGLALAMASGDGYRHAEVLRYPSVTVYPRLFPLVLIRTVDHVPQVRTLAIEVLPRLIAASDHETFAAMLTVACRLQDRMHADPMLELVLTVLRESADDDILAILARLEGRSVRWAGQALIAKRRLQAPQLAMIAIGRFDDRLQERCAEELADQAVPQSDPDLLRPLLKARSARVRTVALTGLIRLGQFDGVDEFLTDRNAAVRATTQWGLRRAGMEPAARYRELLQPPPPSPKPVIQGLGECGQKTDVVLVVPFLDDPRPQTRAAAVNALKHLGAELDLSRFLIDPAPSVTRAVVAYLSERRTLPPVETLRELARGNQPIHIRRSAVSLLREHGVWHRIWVGLTLYDDPDTNLSLDGLSGLGYWCRYQAASINAPIDNQLRSELQALIRSRSNVLYFDTRQTLQWLIGTARPTTTY
ncbi:HEAT repeat domain-containing protein [Glycomyces sp. NPDC046736]|uniref:HEAT repeat domain-containing protein n=1 Tax=Glycomyces sp. NPDC046736 TaxID=3155615 RepID=UPI0033EDC670